MMKKEKINFQYYNGVKKIIELVQNSDLSNKTKQLIEETVYRPVVYVRYAEFSSIDLLVDKIEPGQNILDIGSPQWYTVLKAIDYPKTNFFYINLLEEEISSFKEICALLKVNNLFYKIEDCRKLNFENNFFDLAYSISVLEHISPIKNGDIMALKEIKRVLNKNGSLLLTVPFKEKSNIIYSKEKAYEIKDNEEYFFAREYDNKTFSKLIEKSSLKIDSKYYITEIKSPFSMDYYIWGEGKDKRWGSIFFFKTKGIIEKILRKSVDLLYAKIHLRIETKNKHRLVNIAAKLIP